MITAVIDEIITQIKALGISNTYSYMPLTDTGKLMKEKWQDENILHGCLVRRFSAELDLEESENVPFWEHLIRIELRRTYQDATSKAAHEDELDAILQIFWNDETLNGTIRGITDIRLIESQPYFFFNILCYYGRIEVQVYT